MIKMLALFPPANDSESLDQYLAEQLTPALRDAQGAVSVSVSKGELMSPRGPAPYSRIVTASFEDLSHAIAFGSSPESEAVRDKGEHLGVLVLMFEADEL